MRPLFSLPEASFFLWLGGTGLADETPLGNSIETSALDASNVETAFQTILTGPFLPQPVPAR